MLIEFLIIFQVLTLIVFAFGYFNKSFEAVVIAMILSAIVGFSYYNIEVGETRPTIIDTTTDIVEIQYEKITTVYQNIVLAYVNFTVTIFSMLWLLVIIFGGKSDEVISWLKSS